MRFPLLLCVSLCGFGPAIRAAGMQPELVWQERLSFRGGPVTALAIAPDRSRLAVGGPSGEILVLSLPDGALVGSLKSGSPVAEIAFLGSQALMSAHEGKHLYFNLGQSEPLGEWPRGDAVSYVKSPRIAVSHDRRSFAISVDEGVVTVLDLATGTERRSRHVATSIGSLSFSLDGEELLVSEELGGLLRWRFTTDEEPERIPSSTRSTGASFLAGGGIALCTWDTKAIVGPRSISTENSVDQLVTTGDGSRVTMHLCDAERVLVFDADGTPRKSLRHGPGVEDIVAAVSEDGSWIATGAEDGWVKLWEDGEELARFEGPAASGDAVALSPDGAFVAAQLPRGVVCVERLTGRRIETGIQGIPSTGFQDGEFAIGTTTGALIYDARTGTARTLMETAAADHPARVFPSPAAREAIVQTGSRSSLELTHLDREGARHPLARYSSVQQIAWSADGLKSAIATESWRMCGNSPRAGMVDVLEVPWHTWTPAFEIPQIDFRVPLAVAFRVGRDSVLWADDKALCESRLHDGALLASSKATVWWLGCLDAQHALSHDHERLSLWDLEGLRTVWTATLDPDGHLVTLDAAAPREVTRGPFGFYREWPQEILAAELSRDRETLLLADRRGVNVYRIVR
jgi:WD40 repeat protein